MDLNTIKLDLDKQTAGIWVEIDSETSLCVARMHNPEFNKLFERLTTPHRQSARKGLMDDAKALEIMNIVLAKTVLIGWSGLKRDGEEVPYSEEEAISVLSDPQLASFRELVVDIATNEANYRSEEVAEAGKKLKSSLSGKKSGASK